ncbi:MAG TPA: asparagine synthase-related protein [Candidatus Binatia bacterium]|nr:asparagine synthase-related protein [Candidatus Binatia bacterium]
MGPGSWRRAPLTSLSGTIHARPAERTRPWSSCHRPRDETESRAPRRPGRVAHSPHAGPLRLGSGRAPRDTRPRDPRRPAGLRVRGRRPPPGRSRQAPCRGAMDRGLLAHVLPENSLFRLDRISMASSLETGSPVLDTEVIDLLATVPARMKFGARGKAPADPLRADVPAALAECAEAGIRWWITAATLAALAVALYARRSPVSSSSTRPRPRRSAPRFSPGSCS